MGYLIINETDFQKARNKIKEAQKDGKEIIFTSNDDDLNRKVIEKEKIDVFIPILSGRKDKQKQRDSGFNQVLAKAMKKKKVKMGIDLNELSGASFNEKAKIVGRIRQNVKLCRKEKIQMVFISKEEKNKLNLKSLGIVLGMPTWMTSSL